MISEISLGDKIKCLKCGETFVLENIGMTNTCEYIDCPHCKCRIDVQVYHLCGTIIEKHKKEKRVPKWVKALRKEREKQKNA